MQAMEEEGKMPARTPKFWKAVLEHRTGLEHAINAEINRKQRMEGGFGGTRLAQKPSLISMYDWMLSDLH